MDKRKVIHLVHSHKNFFRFCAKIYNLSLRNKLHAKGTCVSVGVSIIKGLKVISHGCDNEIILGDFVRIKNSMIVLHGNHNKVIIGDFVNIDNSSIVLHHHSNKIIIGDHSYLNQIELYTEDEHNEIAIGSHTSLCGKAHLAAIEGTRIIIGDNCLFSSNLHFATGDSHSILNMQGERINQSKDIVIEDHVWIGTRVTCLKGVHVSRDSIVAATTTLCKDYSVPNAMIGGVPGRIIKTDVNWASERI